MVFSSSIFLCVFLPLFLVFYFLIDKRFKNGWLLFCSILFYAWGAPVFVYILLISTFIDFYIVRQLYREKQIKKRKRWLIISIGLNVGLLAYFKYANFFIENLNSIFISMGSEPISWLPVVLPIGISFYTFQTLTYSIDVYRGVHKPLDRVQDYILYICMFPQLIAGPIVRFNTIADQITNRKETNDDRWLGFVRFCIGLSKKVIIANTLGASVDTILGPDASMLGFNWSNIDSFTAWYCILCYTFQIYFDFSGYSDMAIGIGRMIGFTFPENFDNPYTSRSITEFWRRWHITLGAFMREYLYIPLGGSRVPTKRRMYVNLWFVFLVSGLWHGASWNFVLWGVFHGLFLVLERAFLQKVLDRLPGLVSVLYCFFVVVLSWVIFRIESIDQALIFYSKMFSFELLGVGMQYIHPSSHWMLLIAFVIAWFVFIPKLGRYHGFMYNDRFLLSNKYVVSGFVVIFLILCYGLIVSTDFNPFIYYRF